MYIVEVTPFSKSIRSNSLSYFSSKKIKVGSIVSVPLRSRIIKGLVVEVKDVKELKSEIKQSAYAMKKIKGVSKNLLFSEEFIKAADITAEYFATSAGSIIQSLIPKNLLEDISKLQKVTLVEKIEDEKEHPKFILQADDADRYSEYKSIIRGEFAKNKSVLFCAPTVEDGMFAEKQLSRGIEKHTFTLNSRLTKAKLIKTWNEITGRSKPSLIIVTGGMIGIPMTDIGTIIIDRESSGAWKTQQRPYFDFRYFIEQYASALNSDFIMGDLMLRAETLWRYDQQEFTEYTPIKFRSITDATQKIVNMKDVDELEKPANAISNSLDYLINETIDKSEKIFLMTTRKGLAPIITCGDCGEIVRCEHCSSPIKLHGKDLNRKSAREKENFFKCHTCGHERSAGETCIKCNGWRLTPLGVGTEKIEVELKAKYPKTKIFVLDKEHANTPAKAQKIIQEFNNAVSAILIGTEMALLYLHDPIESVAIVSVDSLFALPDFRIRERILNILLRAKSLASQDFIIQTRNTEDDLFQNIIDGNLTDFYRQEFIGRKKFNYPPFSLIIKISLAAKTTTQIENQFEEVADSLSPQELITYPAFTETVRGKKIVHGMIKLPRENWPDQYLIERLKNLPPQFKIQIDADSVL